jgi:predicted Zn-dependent protease with MMP-like domain
MPGPPSLRRVVLCALGALSIGLGAITLLTGFSTSTPVRLLQGIAVFGTGAAVLGAATMLTMIRLGGWREPESEEEFEALVRRAEALAAAGALPLDGDASDGAAGEDDAAFRALVRSAIDELPLEFHRALEHVAIVVAHDGARYGAYGLYQGDTVARDHFHDHILVFRDTLERDFGHDPELLAAQVRRTVRHELGHHLGWDERGVRRLGL